MRTESVLLEDVVSLAKQLSPIDKLRLLERVTPDLEKSVETQKPGQHRSLLGLFSDLGSAPSADEIDAVRNEIWRDFPRGVA